LRGVGIVGGVRAACQYHTLDVGVGGGIVQRWQGIIRSNFAVNIEFTQAAGYKLGVLRPKIYDKYRFHTQSYVFFGIFAVVKPNIDD
jgi:hypothetical protein